MFNHLNDTYICVDTKPHNASPQTDTDNGAPRGIHVDWAPGITSARHFPKDRAQVKLLSHLCHNWRFLLASSDRSDDQNKESVFDN